MKKRILGVLLAAAMVISVFAGCGSSSNEKKGTVKVGGKAFTEAYLLSEIYSLALENNGYEVNRMYDMATDVIAPAMEKGEIDTYPEYIGTALTDILKKDMLTDKDEVYKAVSDAYAEKGIKWLDLTGCEDKVGLVMMAAKADELGIRTISDLQKKAGSVILGDGVNFSVREDDLLRLNEYYGEFKFKEIKTMEWAQQYPSLENGTVDVIPGLTTDPQLLDDKFRLIEEDITVWPPQYVAPIIRDEVLKQYPEIEGIFNNVSSKITTKNMIEMLDRVVNGDEEYEAVAKDFFEKNCK